MTVWRQQINQIRRFLSNLQTPDSVITLLGYNITVLLAYQQVDANQVTSAEYTGLIWAVLIGWIGFNEMPDLWFAVGSAMIVVPLIMVGLRSRHRVAGYFSLSR